MDRKDIKILLVDDDIDYIYQQEMELKDNGFTVVKAENKEKAKEMAKSENPHIAIVDLMMESMDDGFVLAYDLKKMLPELPIIMVTAVISKTGIKFDSVTEDEKTWIKVDKMFTKPVNIEELVREIERQVSKEKKEVK